MKIYWWSYVTSISHHLPSYSFSWDFFTLSSSICNRQRETTWPNRSLEQINSRGSKPNHLSWLLPCCCCTVHMSPNQTVCHGCCHAVAVHCTVYITHESKPIHLSWLLPCCCCTLYITQESKPNHLTWLLPAVAVAVTQESKPNHLSGCSMLLLNTGVKTKPSVMAAACCCCTLYSTHESKPKHLSWLLHAVAVHCTVHRSPNQTICLAAACFC